MPTDESFDSPSRARARSGNSTGLIFGMSVVGMLVTGLLGYSLHPMISGQTDGTAAERLTPQQTAQVTDAISRALTPIDESLQQIQQQLAGDSDSNLQDETANDRIQKIESEVTGIRSYIDQQIGRMQQVAQAENIELQNRFNETLTQIGDRLAKVDSLSDSHSQLVNKLPEVFRTVTGFRPGDEADAGQATQQDSSSGTSLGAGGQTMGLLIIDNASTQVATVNINGQPEQLQLGRNEFRVPIEDVTVTHPESRLEWRLEASLWDMTDGQYVLHRKWSQ